MAMQLFSLSEFNYVIYIYIYICTQSYIYICTVIYIYICTVIYIYVHSHIYIYIYAHSHIYIYAHSHIYLYVYMTPKKEEYKEIMFHKHMKINVRGVI